MAINNISNNEQAQSIRQKLNDVIDIVNGLDSTIKNGETPTGSFNEGYILASIGGVIGEIDPSSIGTGSGPFFIEVNRIDLNSIIQGNGLIPGALYKINGVDTNLYGGTTIWLTAISENTLSTSGIGLFYNPKYNQNVPGYGLYGYDIPTTQIGMDYIWGGKHWTCIVNTGGPGIGIIDSFTLDSNLFTEVPFSDTEYNLAYDEIKYDIENDIITYRHDGINTVSYDKYLPEFLDAKFPGFNLNISPIKYFQWGNKATQLYGEYKGIGYQTIINSINDNINYKGEFQIFLDFSNGSYQFAINSDSTSKQSDIIFVNSGQYNVSLYSGSGQHGLNFIDSNQNNIDMQDNSSQESIYLIDSNQGNIQLTSGSHQQKVYLTSSNTDQIAIYNFSSQLNIKLYDSNMTYINIADTSIQENITIDRSIQENVSIFTSSSQLDVNILNESLQSNVLMTNNSSQSNITLNAESRQANLTMDSTTQYNINSINSSYIDSLMTMVNQEEIELTNSIYQTNDMSNALFNKIKLENSSIKYLNASTNVYEINNQCIDSTLEFNKIYSSVNFTNNYFYGVSMNDYPISSQVLHIQNTRAININTLILPSDMSNPNLLLSSAINKELIQNTLNDVKIKYYNDNFVETIADLDHVFF